MDKNQAILRQVEYYFSDDSFPFDDFLKSLAAAEGKDGFVEISVLAGFGKMKSFLGQAEDPVATVAAALAESDSLVLSDDKKSVKRLYPIPTEDPALDRTVYAAQFLSEEARNNAIETFSKFGKVESVRSLRNLASDERPYDGGLHVRFEDVSSVQKAIDAALKAEIQGTAGPALLKTLSEHYDDFTKKRLGMRAKREAGNDGSGENSSKKRKIEVIPFDEEYKRGIIVELNGLGEGLDREKIKETCEKFGPIGWVEYERDETSAQLRFNENEHAKALCDADTINIDGFPDAKGKLLEGDEERAYWVRKHEDTAKRMSSRGKGGKGRRGKGGKGRRRN